MADAAFVSCGGAGAPQERRRAVVVNGTHVKTVDVHAHCAVPAAMALMGRKVKTEALVMTDARERLRTMDEQGIDVSHAVQTTFPHRMTRTLKKKPTEYLRQLYFDSIVFTPEALRHDPQGRE